MNVIVSTDALELVAAVAELWGLPTPHDASRQEVFGDYSAQSCGGFLLYDPTTKGWGRLNEDTSLSLFASDWAIDDQLEVSMLMESLKPYRPSVYPDDRGRQVSQPPFLYQGWEFAWVFVPELKRWELAPLGKAQIEGPSLLPAAAAALLPLHPRYWAYGEPSPKRLSQGSPSPMNLKLLSPQSQPVD